MTATTTACLKATVIGEGGEHATFCPLPPPASMMSGERPETWNRPGGSRTEKIPEGPTRRCPVAVKVTVPGLGR